MSEKEPFCIIWSHFRFVLLGVRTSILCADDSVMNFDLEIVVIFELLNTILHFPSSSTLVDPRIFCLDYYSFLLFLVQWQKLSDLLWGNIHSIERKIVPQTVEGLRFYLSRQDEIKERFGESPKLKLESKSRSGYGILDRDFSLQSFLENWWYVPRSTRKSRRIPKPDDLGKELVRFLAI